MEQNFFEKIRRDSYKLLYSQMIMLGIVTLTCLLYAHKLWLSASALLGGMVWIVPSLWFIKYCINKKALLKPQLAFKKIARGELIKFLFSALLIVFCIKFFPHLQVIPFISGFCAAALAPFLAGFFI